MSQVDGNAISKNRYGEVIKWMAKFIATHPGVEPEQIRKAASAEGIKVRNPHGTLKRLVDSGRVAKQGHKYYPPTSHAGHPPV